jgi:hypothetical protein
MGGRGTKTNEEGSTNLLSFNAKNQSLNMLSLRGSGAIVCLPDRPMSFKGSPESLLCLSRPPSSPGINWSVPRLLLSNTIDYAGWFALCEQGEIGNTSVRISQLSDRR